MMNKEKKIKYKNKNHDELLEQYIKHILEIGVNI